MTVVVEYIKTKNVGRPKANVKRATIRVPITFKFQVETGARAAGLPVTEYLENSIVTIRPKEVKQ